MANEREDYNTVCSLVRILADNVSTIRLVYVTDDEEEKILRHLLYVMDGVSTRYEYLNGRPKKYDGKIPRESYDALCMQVQEAKDNALGCITFCTNEIKARPCYSLRQKNYDVLIQYRNWKFKAIDKPRPKDAYTWNEMYRKLDVINTGEMFSFFSQYVHGLSISNIVLNEPNSFEMPLSFAFSLLGWMFSFLRKEYEPHIGQYTRKDLYKIVPEWFLIETM